MKYAKQQQGLTLISWMFVLALLAVVFMFLVNVIPVYLENFSVRSTLASLDKDGSSYGSPGEIHNALIRRFSINDVTSVTREDLDITRGSGGYDVNVSYEVRKGFMFNIDLVLSFDHHVEVPAR